MSIQRPRSRMIAAAAGALALLPATAAAHTQPTPASAAAHAAQAAAALDRAETLVSSAGDGAALRALRVPRAPRRGPPPRPGS